MSDDARAVPTFSPWAPIRRLANGVQLTIGASYAAVYALYAIGRATVGDHDQVVSGNHDPKDFGTGIVTVVAQLLHALAILAVIVGPWAAVPFAVLSIAALALGLRSGMDRRRLAWSLAAVGVTVAVLIAGLPSASDDEIRRWILD